MALLSASVFAGCASVTRHTGAPETPGFVQDRFAIGFWVDPPADERMAERYAEIADANFTLVLGRFGAKTREQIDRQLQLCEKFGLKALVGTRGLEPEQYAEGPACWGYLMRDEPSAADFPALRQQVDAVREARPGRLAYINLFPNYANAGQLGTNTYEEHVARFVDEVRPEVLSMDHYPQFKPGRDGRDAYCANLDVMRRHSLRAGIPFWNFFNTMPYGSHTDPTEAQLRWQVFTSIAYGAKGVLYFCYYTPGGGEFPKGGAIITTDDRRTNHYYQARRINEQLRNLGPTLMKLTSTGVYRLGPDDDPRESLEGCPITSISGASRDPSPDYLIGVFRHADGRRAVMLNNYRFAYTAWPTVTFDVDAAEVVEVDPWSGRELALVDDSPAMEGLQVALDSGAGRLFLLPPSPTR